jgi:ribosomal protein S13
MRVVAQKRELPLSEEEMQTVRALVQRMTTETDRERFRALIEQLRHIVEYDSPPRRWN